MAIEVDYQLTKPPQVNESYVPPNLAQSQVVYASQAQPQVVYAQPVK